MARTLFLGPRLIPYGQGKAADLRNRRLHLLLPNPPLQLIQFLFQPLLPPVDHPGVERKDAPQDSVRENQINIEHAMPP